MPDLVVVGHAQLGKDHPAIARPLRCIHLVQPHPRATGHANLPGSFIQAGLPIATGLCRKLLHIGIDCSACSRCAGFRRAGASSSRKQSNQTAGKCDTGDHFACVGPAVVAVSVIPAVTAATAAAVAAKIIAIANTKLRRAAIVHPDAAAIIAPVAILKALGVADLPDQLHPVLRIDRAALIAIALAAALDAAGKAAVVVAAAPTATISAAISAPISSAVSAAKYKARLASVSHGDAIAIIAPCATLYAGRIAELLDELHPIAGVGLAALGAPVQAAAGDFIASGVSTAATAPTATISSAISSAISAAKNRCFKGSATAARNPKLVAALLPCAALLTAPAAVWPHENHRLGAIWQSAAVRAVALRKALDLLIALSLRRACADGGKAGQWNRGNLCRNE